MVARRGSHPEDGALLVHDGTAALVGYGWVWERIPGEAVLVDGYAHPDADPGVDPALLAWGMQRAQALVDAAGAAMEVKTHCAEDEPRIPLLEAVGLRAGAALRPHGRRPAGGARGAAAGRHPHRACSTWRVMPRPCTPRSRRRSRTTGAPTPSRSRSGTPAMSSARTSTPALWAVAHDGEEVAGAVIGRTDAELGAGWIPTVAVRRPWRGRGLGGALLRAAFAASFGAGYTNVQLGVDTANTTGATRLYEREGMRVAFVLLAYTIDAATAVAACGQAQSQWLRLNARNSPTQAATMTRITIG